MGDFSDKVFAVVKCIPQGKVTTYGQVARLIGSPRSARYVGYALRGNTMPVETPCHRVVFTNGSICEGYAFGGPEVQRKLLIDEGITFLDDIHVNMNLHEWNPGLDLQGRPSDINWEAELGEEG